MVTKKMNLLTINFKQIYETNEKVDKEWVLIIYDISANHYVGMPVYSKEKEGCIYCNSINKYVDVNKVADYNRSKMSRCIYEKGKPVKLSRKDFNNVLQESKNSLIQFLNKNIKNDIDGISYIKWCRDKFVINQKDMITSDYIIYTGDPNFLFKNLIDNSYMPHKLKKKFANKEKHPIHSSFHVAFLVDKDKHPIKDTIILDIPSTKVGNNSINRLMIKDYSYLYEHKPKTVYQAFIVQNMNDYTYWETLKKNNVEEYKKVKNDIANELMNHLINKYPSLEGKISIIDVWTPLTYNEYHSYYGSYMGFAITNKCNCFNITNRIKGIKNFYLATCWQKICGGLPVGLKQGIDIVNHIKHGI